MSRTSEVGCGIMRIPVTLPEGNRVHGTGYCVVITEISFEWAASEMNSHSWTGYPFVSMKH